MSKQSRPEQESKEEINRLIREFQQHEKEEAQQALVLHYRNLVESIARRYSRGRAFHEDICQVGLIGLLGAIRRYDESYGSSFEAFAIPTVVGEIKRFLRDKTWSVHVPRRIKELGPKIKKSVEELTVQLQRSPRMDEIASFIGVSEEEVLETMEMSKGYYALSVDHTMEADAEGGTITLLDIIGQEDEGYEKINQMLVLEKILHVLTDREREIIQYTYIDNISQKDAGRRLNISQMHVSRLQRRAVKKLREALLEEKSE